VGRPTVHVELVADSRVARDLAAGGVFVHGCELAINEQCELVVSTQGEELRLDARVVYVDGQGGAGLELVGFGPAMKAQLAGFVEAAAAFGGDDARKTLDMDMRDLAAGSARDAGRAQVASGESDANVRESDDSVRESDDGVRRSDGRDEGEPNEELEGDDDSGTDEERKISRSMHERLRGLSLHEQVKKAHSPDASERMMLERMYGKAVWEPLLRNPRLTAPEVARLARMGTLPRTMLEVIVGNGSWLQIPEVRRALLSNPRLGTDQILRVLRLMPKHELKLASTQSVYPHAVRDAAKRLVRSG